MTKLDIGDYQRDPRLVSHDADQATFQGTDFSCQVKADRTGGYVCTELDGSTPNRDRPYGASAATAAAALRYLLGGPILVATEE